MDTPLHAVAVPDADPATLKRPETAARELVDAIAEATAGAITRAASLGVAATPALEPAIAGETRG
jgi:hypothetical protein